MAFLDAILDGGQVRAEDTMLAHSVLWSDLPHTLDFLGSMHAKTNAWKHLFHANQVEYSGGDALGTWDVWTALSKEFEHDPASWEVYRDEVSPLTPIIMRATTEGLRLDRDRVRVATEALERRLAAIEAQAQAAVGWPINLGSPQQVEHWLYQVEGIGAGRGRRKQTR
jgi:DNA polymerase I-like protein with 3'-5' exonuclease and polymerase domains